MMASAKTAVDLLEENPMDVLRPVAGILLQICENILNNPQDIKFRRLKLSNKNVSEKLLPAIGAIECLFEMGFEEADDSFVLPGSSPLRIVEDVRNRLATKIGAMDNPKQIPKSKEVKPVASSSRCSEVKPIASSSQSSGGGILRIEPSSRKITNPYLQRVERTAVSVLLYENKALQEKARACVPEDELWLAAQNRLHDHQLEKSSVAEAESQGLPEFFLRELLAWFKYNFFSWVDKPSCKQCNQATNFIGMSSNPVHLVQAPSTELYQCDQGHLTPFHRYTDLARLLESKEGRCGEWAACFTLLCRSFDMDARHVFDETDHVWTEVWSTTQRRWLHCDACEASCDAPLMYQAGWGKKLTYVMAYSRDDIQDVTWRYTQEPVEQVLARRDLCTESELQSYLLDLRSRMQARVSAPRKKFLQQRLIAELSELLHIPGRQRALGESETLGRQSGSAEWRQQRGETGQLNTGWIWKPSKEELVINSMGFKYSAAKNLYVKSDGCKALQSWSQGVFKAKNIARKEERDWKMAYIARTEGCSQGGWIEWKFELPDDCGLEVRQAHLQVSSTVYSSGIIKWCIVGDKPDSVIHIPVGTQDFVSDQVVGCQKITVRVNLEGGDGNVAWQHTQVARQELSDSSFPLQITFSLMKKNQG